MIKSLNQVAWHVHTAKEYRAVERSLYEYSIPCTHSLDRSLVPMHTAIMVQGKDLARACTVILRNFGRRSGVDLL